MRVNYRVTPWMGFLVVALAMALGAWLMVTAITGVVTHVTTDAQPAIIIDTKYNAGATGVGGNRGSGSSTSLTFELINGEVHADSVHGRWFWWPSEGDTIHVYPLPGDEWGVVEDFSWLRTFAYLGMGLLPVLYGLAAVWEWAEKTFFPERWARKERRDRDRRRAASKKDAQLSRRQRAKFQRRPPSG